VKCINKSGMLLTVFLLSCFICGCGQKEYSLEYSGNNSVSTFQFDTFSDADIAQSFAADLCVVEGDVSKEGVNTPNSTSALLFDVNHQDTIHAKGAYEQLNPASLTKVMTALVALKYGNLEDEYTASSNVEIAESGATLIGLKPGDKMTLSQALYALLIPSGNDAAVLIAEGIAGSVEGFSELMNKEAQAIGATGCHFVNPHGLTADNHYVTGYDMYLIFKEAMQYDAFNEIINSTTYSTVYYDRDGNPKEFSCESTNWYLNGNSEAPGQVTVIGGKTGTTNAAQNCLVLLSRDAAGNPYVSVILKCPERGILYEEMNSMLSSIGK